MSKGYKRGFTLIELLVVIAIIGILSAIVLASLGGARTRGADTAIKGQLDSARTQGEVYAGTQNGSYLSFCTSASGASNMLSAAASNFSGAVVVTASNLTAPGVAGAYNKVTCHDTAAAWIIEAPVSSSTSALPQMWCVDSAGSSKSESAVMAATAVACQ